MTVALIDADSLMFQASFNVDTKDEAIKKFDDLVSSIEIECFADSSKLAIKGDNNFRYTIFPNYKGNRKSSDISEEQKEYLEILREHALDTGAVPADGHEADDLVSMWAYEMEYKDNVICHMDKDLNMIPGSHYNYHYNKMTHYEVSEDEADFCFHHQLLTGDPSDNIKGIHGIGEKKANKILYEVPYEKRTEVVAEVWQRRVGGDWQQKMMEAGNLLWLRRFEGDVFTYTDRKGVLYEPTI